MSNVALVVQNSYQEYDDVMDQETLYVDNKSICTQNYITVSDLREFVREDQAILYFDEWEEQASLSLILGLTNDVHRYFDGNHIYLGSPYAYDDLTWDFLVMYASEMDLTYRDEE